MLVIMRMGMPSSTYNVPRIESVVYAFQINRSWQRLMYVYKQFGLSVTMSPIHTYIIHTCSYNGVASLTK